jgi:16S rRNA (guanine527-N7)-methyltransferase
MQLDRIAELLKPFLGETKQNQLTEGDLQNISTYIDMLKHWTARINLTAIRDEEEIVTRHFGESLFTAAQLFPRGKQARSQDSAENELAEDDSVEMRTLADIGSGAGFPGIPIKLWAPTIAVTLIESNQKKATFLREVARTLALTNIEVRNTRAEKVEEKFQVVTLRAVERFEEVLPIAAKLLSPMGRLALLVSQFQVPQAHADLPELTWHHPVPVPQSQSRVLLIGDRTEG